jgi:NAD-dependent dihydropyrimidine dehydrogenase PreA subunit
MYYLMYMSRIKGRVRIQIDREKCKDCGYCIKACKKGVFLFKDGEVIVENEDVCNGCRKCGEVCVYNAIYISLETDQEAINE